MSSHFFRTPEALTRAALDRDAPLAQGTGMDGDGIDGENGVELDLCGLRCPMPVLRTRKALRRLQPGRVLVVTCTDPLARVDIPHLLRETGDTLLGCSGDARASRFTIRKT